MMIDCDSCTVRGAACTDCVVTFLTIPVRPSTAPAVAPGAAGAAVRPSVRPAVRPAVPGAAAPDARVGPIDLDEDERAAIRVLASSGLVPPLRMVRVM